MSKYAKLLKTVKIRYNSYLNRFMMMQMSGQIPLYVTYTYVDPVQLLYWCGCPCDPCCFWPQGPKKQQNNDIGVSLELFKHALQMNFSPINKLSSFTNMVTNIKNYKNHKFDLKWPEHLQALII